MEQEYILTPKLAELENRMTDLILTIRRSESGDPQQLKQEIDRLTCRAKENRKNLEDKMSGSQGASVKILWEVYRQIQNAIDQGDQALLQAAHSGEDRQEQKILLAEYSLDFAFQAAERALLDCLQAIVGK